MKRNSVDEMKNDILLNYIDTDFKEYILLNRIKFEFQYC